MQNVLYEETEVKQSVSRMSYAPKWEQQEQTNQPYYMGNLGIEL
jgi:hypothetical protein